MHETLEELTGKRFRLHRALVLATWDRTPLSDRVVNATLRLRDLLEEACSTADDAQWLRDTLRAIAASRTERTDSSASDSSTATGQRRREEPSSGRGNSKRATFSGSDSDSGPHPRRAERDRRQVSPVIFHAAEQDSDTTSFPPRIFRPRVTQRLPSRALISCMVNASDADPPLLTTDSRGGHDRGNSRRRPPPCTHGPMPAPITQPTGPVAATTHPAAISPDTVPPFVRSVSVAPPPPSVCTVNPRIYSTVTPASVPTLPLPANRVVPTTRPAPASTRTAPPRRPRSPPP